MESFFSRNRNALVLISVLLAQVIGLAVQVRRPGPNPGDKGGVRLIRSWVIGAVAPPERWLHAGGLGIRGIWDNYINLVHVRQQNQDLRTQLDNLRLEEASIAEDARQAQRLQALLGFREKYVYHTVAAQVVGSAGTEHSRVLLIDKGLREGIKPDMPVITPDGIVGKTRDVFAHTTQVLEISDSTSGAGVILEKTRIRGVLRGNSWGQPEIINVSPDERIKPGEAVLTSGGDAIFPRGLPVGTVQRVVPDPDGTLVNVLIRPAANLSRLEEVLVITSTGDKMPAAMQDDLADAEQKASDVLAERLPSRNDPNAASDQQQDQNAATVDNEGRPMRPPQAVHPDHFSPNDTPPANALVPGQRLAPPLSGTEDSSHGARPQNAANAAPAGPGSAGTPVTPGAAQGQQKNQAATGNGTRPGAPSGTGGAAGQRVAEGGTAGAGPGSSTGSGSAAGAAGAPRTARSVTAGSPAATSQPPAGQASDRTAAPPGTASANGAARRPVRKEQPTLPTPAAETAAPQSAPPQGRN